MNREQATIKIENAEIPVVALDSPLMWVVAILVFCTFIHFINKKWGG